MSGRKKRKEKKQKQKIETLFNEPPQKRVPKIIGWLPLIYVIPGILAKPGFDPFSLCLLLALPLNILFMYVYPGLIPLYEKKRRISTTGYDGLFLVPSAMLLIRAVTSYPVFSYLFVNLGSMFLCLPLFFLLWPLNEKVIKKWFDYLLLYGFLVFSVVSTVLFLNGALDQETPKLHETTIQSKYVSKGRGGTSYKIIIQPWGLHTDTELRSVSRSQYERVNAGDPIKIFEYPGFFGVPWFKMDKI